MHSSQSAFVVRVRAGLAAAIVLSSALAGSITQAESESATANRAAADRPSSVAEHLGRGELSEALQQLQRIPADQLTEQQRFWRAWCHAALGQTARAKSEIATLKQLEDDQSGWSDQARELERLLDQLPDNLEQHLRLISEFSAQLDKAETWKCRIRHHAPNGSILSTGMAFDLDGSRTEIALQQNGEPRIAVRYADSRLTLLLPESDVMSSYATDGSAPALQLTFTQEESGKCNLSFGIGIRGKEDPSETRSARILNAPAIATPQDVRRVLEHSIRTGSLPRATESRDGMTVMTWVSPEIDVPEWKATQTTFDARGRLHSFRLHELEITEIEYGSRQQVKLTTREWPQREVVDRGKFSPVVLFQFMQTAARTWTEFQKAPGPISEADRPNRALR